MDEIEAWEKYQEQLSPLAKAGASVAGKLDTLAQQLSEIGVDTSRTAETVIPQLEGDQNAIDVANDQAAGMGGMGGDMGGMPIPDAGGMGAPAGAPPGAPAPDIMPDMPSEGADIGNVGGGASPGMDGDAPLDDMGDEMPSAGSPTPDAGMAPPMGGPMDDMGGQGGMGDIGGAGPGGEPNPLGQLDFNEYAYSDEDALNDFISAVTESAHTALDEGDTEKVANITGFIDGVKQLWEQYMGGTAMPGGLDPAQSMDMPPTIESEGPAGDVGGEAVGPESAGEPPMPEGGADEGPKEESEEDKPESDSEKKDDDEEKDVKKSEKCDDAEKSEDGETAEGGDAVEEGDAEKATGKTDIGPTEGVKKSFMEARMEEMEAVMNDSTNYLNTPTQEIRPQLRTYEKTSDFDMSAVLEEFKTGVFKSSRPAPQSVMGGVHGSEGDAMKKSAPSLFSDIFHDGEPVVEEKSEFEMQLESFVNGLRAH